MADNLFAVCEPRADVLQGALKESDFAADLSQVLRGDAPDEYRKPELFFANTYPTRGLKNALTLVALRVLGKPEQVGAIFRLDTQFTTSFALGDNAAPTWRSRSGNCRRARRRISGNRPTWPDCTAAPVAGRAPPAAPPQQPAGNRRLARSDR